MDDDEPFFKGTSSECQFIHCLMSVPSAELARLKDCEYKAAWGGNTFSSRWVVGHGSRKVGGAQAESREAARCANFQSHLHVLLTLIQRASLLQMNPVEMLLEDLETSRAV